MEDNLKDILDKCMSRLDAGRTQYGDDSYLEKDMYDEMIEELFDTINYAVMEIKKLKKLQKQKNENNL